MPNERDYYPTPQWCIDAVVKDPAFALRADTILDLGCGDGRIGDAFAEAADALWLKFVDIDTSLVVQMAEVAAKTGSLIRDPGGYAAISDRGRIEIAITEADFLSEEGLDLVRRSLWGCGTVGVVMNPPFSAMGRFVEHAVELVAPLGWVCALLPRTFSSQATRAAWVKKHPYRAIWELYPRPSFGLNKHGHKGTAFSSYAWCFWGSIPEEMKTFRMLIKRNEEDGKN
jgi:SAM-dependent methyltransferase